MKFCEECGQKLLKNEKFCPKCGKKQVEEKVAVSKTVKNTEVKKAKSSTEGLGTASMVLGIISLIFSFVFTIFLFPVYIIGLILGIVSKANHGKRISGIILNSLAIVISIIMFFVWIALIVTVAEEYDNQSISIEPENTNDIVVGKWNCKETEKISDKDSKYTLTVKINDDSTFSLGDHDKIEDTYVTGDYTIDDNPIDRFMKKRVAIALELDAKSKFEDEKFKENIDKEYVMIFTNLKDKNNSMLIDEDSGKTYICDNK